MQGWRLLELYDDLAVGLPPVVLDEVFQMLRESLAVQFVFRSDVVVIARTQQQCVAVGRKDGTVAEILQRLLGFALQAVLDLLRGHLTTENSRKTVVNSAFELAFNSLQDPHRDLLPRHSSVSPCIWPCLMIATRTDNCATATTGASCVTPASWVWPVTGAAGHRLFEYPRTPEFCRSGAVLLSSSSRRTNPVRRHARRNFGGHGRVAEWQTRWLQVPVSFGTWGFKSPFAHHERKLTR